MVTQIGLCDTMWRLYTFEMKLSGLSPTMTEASHRLRQRLSILSSSFSNKIRTLKSSSQQYLCWKERSSVGEGLTSAKAELRYCSLRRRSSSKRRARSVPLAAGQLFPFCHCFGCQQRRPQTKEQFQNDLHERRLFCSIRSCFAVLQPWRSLP